MTDSLSPGRTNGWGQAPESCSTSAYNSYHKALESPAPSLRRSLVRTSKSEARSYVPTTNGPLRSARKRTSGPNHSSHPTWATKKKIQSISGFQPYCCVVQRQFAFDTACQCADEAMQSMGPEMQHGRYFRVDGQAGFSPFLGILVSALTFIKAVSLVL